MNPNKLAARAAFALAFFVWVPLTGLTGVRVKPALEPLTPVLFALLLPRAGAMQRDLLPAAPGQEATPVDTATPLPDGQIIHVVEDGQDLSSIAAAYTIGVDDLRRLNDLPSGVLTVTAGQRLLIQGGRNPQTLQPGQDPPSFSLRSPEPLLSTAVKGVRMDAGARAVQQEQAQDSPIPDTGERRKDNLRIVLAAVALVGVGLIVLGLLMKG